MDLLQALDIFIWQGTKQKWLEYSQHVYVASWFVPTWGGKKRHIFGSSQLRCGPHPWYLNSRCRSLKENVIPYICLHLIIEFIMWQVCTTPQERGGCLQILKISKPILHYESKNKNTGTFYLSKTLYADDMFLRYGLLLMWWCLYKNINLTWVPVLSLLLHLCLVAHFHISPYWGINNNLPSAS